MCYFPMSAASQGFILIRRARLLSLDRVTMPVNDIANPRTDESNAVFLNQASFRAALLGITFLRSYEDAESDDQVLRAPVNSPLYY